VYQSVASNPTDAASIAADLTPVFVRFGMAHSSFAIRLK
jgi:hypothetical protein